ncbi:GroES-like protein [Choiromyces venosus 120613-1]|uniref:GroES-like protein n=1 Tax=Choiromyces venosus 120613-1 TaxID=1336337 RepID=A0A3N4IXD3_9PEZI|nr:GroES-like protein [Choiromyces venosus 120613-1]
MAVQKASLYEKKGEFPVLGERPVPSPSEEQVLVKILSAGVNPVDWKRIELDFVVNPTWPQILGCDIAGEVSALGSSVKNFKVGDRVFFQASAEDRNQSAFQQYAVQNHDLISKTPNHISDDRAATIPLASFTALVGLFHHTGLNLHPPRDLEVRSRPRPPNTTSILILGGASNVGQFALQFAKMVGFETIITTASRKNHELVTKLGATHVFDRHTSDLSEQIKAVSGEDLRYAFDTTSNEETYTTALKALADRHPVYLACVLPVPEDESRFPKKPDGSEWKMIFASPHQWRELGVPYYKTIGTWLKTNQIKTPKPVVMPGGLNAVNDALKKLKEGKVSAEKLIIKPWAS